MNILPTFARHQFLPTRFGVAISILLGTVAAFQSGSAVVVEDVMGIKWGTSREDTKLIMLAKPGVHLAGPGDGKLLGFAGGNFERWSIENCAFGFDDDKFQHVHVAIARLKDASSTPPPAFVPIYIEAKKLLTSKYGPPDETSENVQETGARRAVATHYAARWFLSSSPVAAKDVTVECLILYNRKNSEYRVSIEYTKDQLASAKKTERSTATGARQLIAEQPKKMPPNQPTPYRDSLAVAVGTGFATVKLKDGRTLQGDILTEDSEQFVLQTESPTGVTLSKFTLKKSDVATVDKWKRQQRLQSLQTMANAVREQIKSAQEAFRHATVEHMYAERKWEKYRASMSKTHGDSGTLTQLQMDVNSAKAKAATAGKQKQQLEAQKQALEQKIAQVHD